MVETVEQNLKTESKAKVNPLKLMYLETKDLLTPESQMFTSKYNITPKLKEYIMWKINNGELSKIAIRGQVRTGKSTVGVVLMSFINDMLIEKGLRPSVDKFKCIMADQTEYLRFAKKGDGWQNDKGEWNISILIDEYNKMAESGVNATTESNLLQHHNNVFAAKYVHTVGCTPTGFIDHLTEVFLDVIGKGVDADGRKYTRLKLLYKDPVDRFGQNMMMLGWVDILVDNVLKSDFYRRYYLKKMKRLDLLQSYGIIDERPMEMAEFVLKIFDQLKEDAEFEKVSPTFIRATMTSVKFELQQMQMYSMFYDAEVLQPVSAMLDYVYWIHKRNKQINKLKSKKGYNPEMLQKLVRSETNARQKLANLIKTQQMLMEVQRKYHDIK